MGSNTANGLYMENENILICTNTIYICLLFFVLPLEINGLKVDSDHLKF